MLQTALPHHGILNENVDFFAMNRKQRRAAQSQGEATLGRPVPAKMKAIIISGADAAYWPLLSGMLHSIEHAVRKENMAVGVLDLGLAPEHRDRLLSYGAIVVEPKWDYPIAHFRKPPPTTFRAMTARPFLPRYFPGYDLYIWLDADCWVQDWQAIKLLATAASQKKFAIVAEVHRSYGGFRQSGTYLEWLHGCYRHCYGDTIANSLSNFPLLNVGVFAGTSDAAQWSRWQWHLGEIIKQHDESFFFAEQTALNGAIREGNLATALLPAHCNWMCNRAMPGFNPERNIFTEPEPPYLPLGIIHVAASVKTGVWPVLDQTGKTHMKVLTYPLLPM